MPAGVIRGRISSSCVACVDNLTDAVHLSSHLDDEAASRLEQAFCARDDAPGVLLAPVQRSVGEYRIVAALQGRVPGRRDLNGLCVAHKRVLESIFFAFCDLKCVRRESGEWADGKLNLVLTMLALLSITTTTPVSPMSCLICNVTSPLPHPTSMTFSPGFASRRVSTGAVNSFEYTNDAVF